MTIVFKQRSRLEWKPYSERKGKMQFYWYRNDFILIKYQQENLRTSVKEDGDEF